jgi:hypothetical protein
MKMTIKELIEEMKEEYTTFLEGTGLDDQLQMKKERENDSDCDRVCTANEMAINILCKYQKIEEIYKNWSYGADSCDCMKDIERVIEDE